LIIIHGLCRKLTKYPFKEENIDKNIIQDDLKNYELGVAGKLTKAFITSPLSIILFFAMLGAGIMELISTPRQEDPQISVPMGEYFVTHFGNRIGHFLTYIKLNSNNATTLITH
jgi:hypothetical protein